MSQDSTLSTTPPNDLTEERLLKAVLLKDHAISKGITVSESILELLNEAECAADKRSYLCPKNGLKIDKAISELTNFTYPTTGETLLALYEPAQFKKIEKFKSELPWWLLLATVVFAVGYFLLHMTPPRLLWGNILLSSSLGLLGSVMYQVFNTIGVIKEKAFSLQDIYSNRLRIYIGPAIGLLFYFALTIGALPEGKDLSAGLAILLPFLAGFSTKLVVGVLDKMVQAVMLAFGIEDKRTDVLVRQRRNQTTAGSVPPGGDEALGGSAPESETTAPKTVTTKPSANAKVIQDQPGKTETTPADAPKSQTEVVNIGEPPTSKDVS